MKYICGDCGAVKSSVTRCALCNRRLCSYCYKARHNVEVRTPKGAISKRKGCLSAKSANLFTLAGNEP